MGNALPTRMVTSGLFAARSHVRCAQMMLPPASSSWRRPPRCAGPCARRRARFLFGASIPPRAAPKLLPPLNPTSGGPRASWLPLLPWPPCASSVSPPPSTTPISPPSQSASSHGGGHLGDCGVARQRSSAEGPPPRRATSGSRIHLNGSSPLHGVCLQKCPNLAGSRPGSRCPDVAAL